MEAMLELCNEVDAAGLNARDTGLLSGSLYKFESCVHLLKQNTSNRERRPQHLGHDWVVALPSSS